MTQQTSVDLPVEDQVISGCCHHWVIQPATGPVSEGKCQNCGESRGFKNYVEASTWGADKSARRDTSMVMKVVSGEAGEEDEGEE